jgi:hypothetical protein
VAADGASPRNALFPRPESSARISERGPEFNGGWLCLWGPVCSKTALPVPLYQRGGSTENPGAVVAAHQDAVLGRAVMAAEGGSRAAIAALRNMLRMVGKDDTGEAGHAA